MVQEHDNFSPCEHATQGHVHLDMCIPPDSGAVPAARHAVQQVCLSVGISGDECADLDLALGEALANAVVHGGVSECPKAHRPEVHISAWNFQSLLIVEVRDCGAGFEPPPPPYEMPGPETDATHGRGLPLMEMLTDAFVVCRGDTVQGGSSTFLVKATPDLR